jgi:hypothetical protein
VTARDDIRVPFGFAFAMANRPVAEVDELLDEYEAAHRTEVLTETANDWKAHCLTHNRFAAAGFAECPCRMADELLRMAKEAGRG